MTFQPEHLTQVDQMGRPAINTVFNHGVDKNTFNVTPPAAQREHADGGWANLPTRVSEHAGGARWL